MGERDHAVHMGKLGERCRVGLSREVVGNCARGGGRAVHTGQDADVVARGHAAVGPLDTHEHRFTQRGLRLDVSTKRIVALEGAPLCADPDVVGVHMLAGSNVAECKADDLVVAAHRLALRDRAHRELVAWRHKTAHRHAFDLRAANELATRNHDIIKRVQADERLNGIVGTHLAMLGSHSTNCGQ